MPWQADKRPTVSASLTVAYEEDGLVWVSISALLADGGSDTLSLSLRDEQVSELIGNLRRMRRAARRARRR